MTTAERSAAVTRAGRTGVGRIGSSIRPRMSNPDPWGGDDYGVAPDDSMWTTYDKAYANAKALQDSRSMRANPRGTVVDQWVDVTGNPRYRGHTWDREIFPEDASPYIHSMVPSYMKRTLDWAATRAPLRRTTSTKKRSTKR